jgi:glutamate racemase
MKMIVTENLYFNKVDMLEVRSGNKSFYAKDTKQFEYGNHTGYYIIEIFKNYIATLKEEGITSIVFSNSETKFTKQDRTQIMQIAKCFYESVAGKK